MDFKDISKSVANDIPVKQTQIDWEDGTIRTLGEGISGEMKLLAKVFNTEDLSALCALLAPEIKSCGFAKEDADEDIKSALIKQCNAMI